MQTSASRTSLPELSDPAAEALGPLPARQCTPVRSSGHCGGAQVRASALRCAPVRAAEARQCAALRAACSAARCVRRRRTQKSPTPARGGGGAGHGSGASTRRRRRCAGRGGPGGAINAAMILCGHTFDLLKTHAVCCSPFPTLKVFIVRESTQVRGLGFAGQGWLRMSRTGSTKHSQSGR